MAPRDPRSSAGLTTESASPTIGECSRGGSSRTTRDAPREVAQSLRLGARPLHAQRRRRRRDALGPHDRAYSLSEWAPTASAAATSPAVYRAPRAPRFRSSSRSTPASLVGTQVDVERWMTRRSSRARQDGVHLDVVHGRARAEGAERREEEGEARAAALAHLGRRVEVGDGGAARPSRSTGSERCLLPLT